ncbi:MAG: hypothetical protein KA436_11650 [Oligoflexales bacterium]|nr:hypothetical protein [Oligoflexales bacterium]
MTKSEYLDRLERSRMGASWFLPKIQTYVLLFLSFSAASSSFAKVKIRHLQQKASKEIPLSEQSLSEILENYSFIADFRQKEELLNISEIPFWKYPFKVEKAEFDFDLSLGALGEMPATLGVGREFEHINRGRVFFLEGNIEEAKTTWLSARARFGTKFKFHRRNDYFIGLAFLKLAEELRHLKGGDWEESEVRSLYANAGTFFSWAFIKKKEELDPVVDAIMPRGLYNLAVIYHRYGRYGASHATAAEALEFLLKTGRKELRSRFRQILVDSLIKNRSYLKAVQELDTGIRQDSKDPEVPVFFTKVANIYFDLNNYSLAEDIFDIADAVSRKMDQDPKPMNSFLRGESLFWLGEFKGSAKVFEYGLRLLDLRRGPLTEKERADASWALLRLADTYLARHLFYQAQVFYFRVLREYPKSPAAAIAEVRRACLELPAARGNNVKHGRELLSSAKKKGDIPANAMEIAWACETRSYSEREKTASMVLRVEDFLKSYPNSDFLKDFIPSVQAVDAAVLDEALLAKNWHRAVQFYEVNEAKLFFVGTEQKEKGLSTEQKGAKGGSTEQTPIQTRLKLSEAQKKGLFTAYVELFQSEKAEPFFLDSMTQVSDDLFENLRLVTFLLELRDLSPNVKKWAAISQKFSTQLLKSKKSLVFQEEARPFLQRLLNTGAVHEFTPWLYSLFEGALPKKADLLCDPMDLLLSVWIQALPPSTKGKNEQSHLLKEKLGLVIGGKNFLELLTKKKECAYTYLGLEEKVYEGGQAGEYALRWLNRLDWPLAPEIVGMQWRASEALYKSKDQKKQAAARKIWLSLKEKAGAYPEAKFAKLRLEEVPGQDVKMEYEKLWKP